MESKGRTTYNEVADELVQEFSAPHLQGAHPCMPVQVYVFATRLHVYGGRILSQMSNIRQCIPETANSGSAGGQEHVYATMAECWCSLYGYTGLL